MPRSTAHTVRCSREVPTAGSQLAIAAQLTVRPGDGHGADVGAHAGVGAGLVPQRRLEAEGVVVGDGVDAGLVDERQADHRLVDVGREPLAHEVVRRSGRWPCRWRCGARGALSSSAVPVLRVAACSAERSSRTRSCRAVARSPRAVARAATSASPTRASSTLVARLSETAPTRAATSTRGRVSTESVCHRPESPTHSLERAGERLVGRELAGRDGARRLDEEEHLADGRRAEGGVGVDLGERHTGAVADAQRPRDATGVGELDVHVRQGNPATR